MGGLSVTGCLADFSVYVFHPYGGKASLKEAQWSPLADAERKDSLSINVEFVKFHLARSRKLDLHADPDRSKATVRFSSECRHISCVPLRQRAPDDPGPVQRSWTSGRRGSSTTCGGSARSSRSRRRGTGARSCGACSSAT